jgi:cysteine desulfuration protein SufE
MQTINEIQNEIIEDFSMLEDWNDKYEYLIDFGKSLPLIDEQYKTEENRIHGCQSRVWLHAEMKENQLFFYADSDAIITKGIVGLLVKVSKRTHTQRNCRNRIVFHRKNWIERTLISYSCQWSCEYD